MIALPVAAPISASHQSRAARRRNWRAPQASFALLQQNESSGLTFKQLSKVAAYFGGGVLFFLERTPVEKTCCKSVYAAAPVLARTPSPICI
ncbi:hypothetical protein C7W93_18455 [Glaciimonas sp. PCH181]|nr:hypothetical protein C7W93_18455 [Glaciimonas sp. PCH181]